MLSNSVSLFGLLDVTDCPPTADGEEPEQPSQSGGKAKRLPREVKQKLAKVARLAVSSGCTGHQCVLPCSGNASVFTPNM